MQSSKSRLTPNQIRGFWTAWGGWALDGMDSFIYALVLVPALRDLLPKSGIPATTANVGFYGGLLFALLLIGWGTALVWGPIADRFGRVKTLMLTISWFSLWTLLSAFSTNVWELAVFRFLAGTGIGGEWSVGASYIAEEWPEDLRKKGVVWMHTGYYFGFFLAALANYFIGSHYGWRYMFVVGGMPALFVAVIRRGVKESARWENRQRELKHKWTAARAFREIFTPRYRRRTILNSIYTLVSVAGLWAGSVYAPAAVADLCARSGRTVMETERFSSYGTALIGFGTILGALTVPALAHWLGRKATLAIFYTIMLVFIPVAFEYVFYLSPVSLGLFMLCLFMLGVGGANFAVYSVWLPEQYVTECRTSAFAFTTNVSRFGGAIITYIVGAGVRHYQTLGTPVALTGLAFVIGLMLLPLGVETKDDPLPS